MTMPKSKDWLQIIPGKSAPDYVVKMKEIMIEAWAQGALGTKMDDLKERPTWVLRQKGLITTANVTAFSHSELDGGVFHFPIPRFDATRDDIDLTLLAAHLIRCCSEC